LTAPSRAKVLCVDDEPNVLEGLSLTLRRRVELQTASGGAQALEILKADPSFAVIISDMRMPGMDGATFLSRARELVPDTTRLLLTGHSELNAAISAVNEGRIFRFLTKPCPPPVLLEAVESAAEQHRLVTAERVLLESTLRGTIQTLTEVLSLTNPVAFGRATMLRQRVKDIATELKLDNQWQVEIAAMLSGLGTITLPPETLEKVVTAKLLSEAEQKMVDRVPAVTDQLLAHIPRLESVREIIQASAQPTPRVLPEDPGKLFITRAAGILRLALDTDVLEAQGNTRQVAIDTLRGRGKHLPEALDAWARLSGEKSGEDIRDLPISQLRPGMIFMDDVNLTVGTLLAARGYEVTRSFVARAHNFRPGTIREPVRVLIPPGI
jgi:CheY-like chemotaxis protein